jgi:hypothetical protein
MISMSLAEHVMIMRKLINKANSGRLKDWFLHAAVIKEQYKMCWDIKENWSKERDYKIEEIPIWKVDRIIVYLYFQSENQDIFHIHKSVCGLQGYRSAEDTVLWLVLLYSETCIRWDRKYFPHWTNFRIIQNK